MSTQPETPAQPEQPSLLAEMAAESAGRSFPFVIGLVVAGLYELLIGRTLPLDEQEVGDVVVDPHAHAEVTARLDAVPAHMELVPAPVPPASREPIRSNHDV